MPALCRVKVHMKMVEGQWLKDKDNSRDGGVQYPLNQNLLPIFRQNVLCSELSTLTWVFKPTASSAGNN